MNRTLEEAITGISVAFTSTCCFAGALDRRAALTRFLSGGEVEAGFYLLGILFYREYLFKGLRMRYAENQKDKYGTALDKSAFCW